MRLYIYILINIYDYMIHMMPNCPISRPPSTYARLMMLAKPKKNRCAFDAYPDCLLTPRRYGPWKSW